MRDQNRAQRPMTATRSPRSTASTSTADADVRSALEDAGFAVSAVVEEYTKKPADASTLRATWAGRLLPS